MLLLAGALVGAVGGWLVPRIVAAVPEPTEPEPAEPEPKVPYAQVASRPGLALRTGVVGLLVGALTALALGPDPALALLLGFLPSALALAVIDWRTRLLPTWLIRHCYAALVPGLVVVALVEGRVLDLWHSAVGAVVALGLYWVLWRVRSSAMGYGDVRLSGVLGLLLGWLGWAQLAIGLYAGFLLGGVVGLMLWLARVVDHTKQPFGPFMLAGAWLGAVAGPPVVDWLGFATLS